MNSFPLDTNHLRKVYDNGFNGCEPYEDVYTKKAKVTFDAVRFNGKANQAELAADFSIYHPQYGVILANQTGLRKRDAKTIPFTDRRVSDIVVTEIIDGYINIMWGDKNEWEMYAEDSTHFIFAVNTKKILRFTVPSGSMIVDFNLHSLSVAYSSFPFCNAYPALLRDSSGFYVSPIGIRNIWGESNVGYNGHIQNQTLSHNEINLGGSTPKVAAYSLLCN